MANKFHWRRVFLYAILLLFAAFYLMPLVVMIFTSLKSLDEVYAGTFISPPPNPSFNAWRVAWSEGCIGTACVGLEPYFLNSIRMVIPAVLISTMLGALNGYILTKWRFKGSELLFGFVLFGCFLPLQAVILPIAFVLGSLGLAGSVYGLILVHSVYGIAFTTLFFRNYFVTIPTELVKAATIDGAGFFRIFFSIMLPAALPIIVVSCIWQFTGVWNDFLFGNSFSSGSQTPVTVALNNMVNVVLGRKQYNTDMAAAMIAALPTLLVYVFGGRYFVRGLTAGAVKG
ncbi:carbohydrate ABC transporter permease [Rhizobium sp. BK060]|uniref:carbohydrate ABC transporter permease n=1 Tax=Rhizobium sp. BK060 TaxID=2587096 RepID=UPI00160DAAF4|nr:carbohydrate ABC transporter permease [Rhizobium sp. BK060]MBB3396005.1 glucose/mannose transport system permease protein [Rhizobium sp. BK060]